MPEPIGTPAPAPAATGAPAAPPATPPATPPAPAPGAKPADPPISDPTKTVPLAALHESREQAKALKEEVEVLKQAITGLQPQQQPYQQPGAPQQPYQQPPQAAMVDQQLAELWDTDPRKGMQAEMNLALNWYDSTGAAVDAQEAQTAGKHPDFNNYRDDIRRYLRAIPMNRRADPGVVELAYFAVKGQKVDSILEQNQKTTLERLQAGETVQGIAGTFSAPAVAPAASQPTQEQAATAAAMGLTVEQYMTGVK